MELTGKVIVFIQPENETNARDYIEKEYPLIKDSVILTSIMHLMGDKEKYGLNDNQVDAVVACSEDLTTIGDKKLDEIIPLLKPGGKFYTFINANNKDIETSVMMAMMTSGLVVMNEVDTYDLASSAYPKLNKPRLYGALKPTFEAGSSVRLRNVSNTTNSLAKKWQVTADDFQDDDDMIDEDTLLDDDAQVLKAAKEDCGVGTGKRRACKNCTCGLKDQEDKPVVTDKELSQMVSSCGNCYKGDAFRCGGCPFLGKPAFKPGMEKVKLNMDDSDDI